MDNNKNNLLEKYLSDAKGWNNDIHDSAYVNRNRYFVISVFALMVSFLAVYAVFSLAPLKETVPYLYEIDKSTGIVTHVQRIDMESYKPKELVTKSYISQYVLARETINRKDNDIRFTRVQMLSEKKVSSDYVEFMKDSPRSPLAVFGENESRAIYIRDILKLNKRDAFYVEFESTDKRNNLPKPLTLYWAVVIEYRYINMPTDNKYRYNNPLGFQVTYYKKDQKVIQ